MTMIIRGAGVIWTGLFSLICLACLVMPYFLPVGWPSALPPVLRVIGLIIYLVANLAVGGYAASIASTRPYAAATTLAVAIFIFALIMTMVTLGLSPHTHGADWQAHAMIGTLAAATVAGVMGITVLLTGLAVDRRRSVPPPPTS